MDFLRRLLETEPAVLIGVVTSALALAVNFGLPITGVQVDAIVQFVTNLLLMGGAIFAVRQSVFAPATVEKIVEEVSPAGPDVNYDAEDGE